MKKAKLSSGELLNRSVFAFNVECPSSEVVTLITEIYSNGEPNGIYINQELNLQSNLNSASLNLHSTTLTPELLRELANELDKCIIVAKCALKNSIDPEGDK